MARIVVFDLGGVMVRIHRTWQACANASGISTCLPPQPPVFLWDLNSLNRYQAGQTDIETYYQELGQDLGISPEDAVRLHAGILREPYPGTLDLVHELDRRAIPTGILSNTNKPHWDRMMDPALFPNIAGLGVKVASFEVELEKPDEAIYRRYEQISGCQPEEIVFFDDTAINVTAAKVLGWDAHVVDPHGNTAAQMREILVLRGLI